MEQHTPSGQVELGMRGRAALIVAAKSRSWLPFPDLCEAVGYKEHDGIGVQSVGNILDAVRAVCAERGEPNLAMVAGSKKTGMPKPAPETCDGLSPTEYVLQQRALCYSRWGL